MRHLNMDCIGCGVDTDALNEFYMVTDELWKKAVPDKHEQENSVLCIGCLETRIGRQLVASDFTDAPVNTLGQRSDRLKSRVAAT